MNRKDHIIAVAAIPAGKTITITTRLPIEIILQRPADGHIEKISPKKYHTPTYQSLKAVFINRCYCLQHGFLYNKNLVA